MPEYRVNLWVELQDVENAKEATAVLRRVLGQDSHIVDHSIDDIEALSGDAPEEDPAHG